MVQDTNELLTNRPFMIRLYSRPRRERDNEKRVDLDGNVQEIGGRLSEAEFSSLPADRAPRPGLASNSFAPPPPSNAGDYEPPTSSDGFNMFD